MPLAPCFPSMSGGRRGSCPEVSAAQNGASDDSSQVMSCGGQYPNYMRGNVQGFNESISGSSESSNTYQNGDSYTRGYIEGLKASTGMREMMSQG